MKKILTVIGFLLFKRIFKKYVGKSVNPDQEKMFYLAEAGLEMPEFGRASGVSTFIIVYAQWNKVRGLETVVIGSKYLRALSQTLLKTDRKFPIILHNSDYAKAIRPDLILIDQSDSLSVKFHNQVIVPLTATGVRVVEIDTK